MFLKHLCFSPSTEQYTSTAHDISNVIVGNTKYSPSITTAMYVQNSEPRPMRLSSQ